MVLIHLKTSFITVYCLIYHSLFFCRHFLQCLHYWFWKIVVCNFRCLRRDARVLNYLLPRHDQKINKRICTIVGTLDSAGFIWFLKSTSLRKISIAQIKIYKATLKCVNISRNKVLKTNSYDVFKTPFTNSLIPHILPTQSVSTTMP